MDEKVKFTLSAKAVKKVGGISGSGYLKFATDASSMCLSLDYKSKNRMVLSLTGTQGIKLSSSTKLNFSEKLSRDLVNKEWGGKFAIKIEISESVAAQLIHEFTRNGPKTTAEFTLRL